MPPFRTAVLVSISGIQALPTEGGAEQAADTMETPSAPAHRGLVPRQGLLLAASLLTIWSLPTTAQLTIESVPPNAAEGKDVLLRVHNLPGDLVGYTWYKGERVHSDLQIVSYVIDTQKTTYGPAYSDREKIYPNGSLLFQNVTQKDTGNYTLLATEKDYKEKQVTGQLRVYYGPDAPTISPSDSHYLRGTNLNLSCHAATNPPAQYSWFFNGRPHHSKQELFIPNLTSNDSGSYACLAHNSVTGLNRTTVKTITISAEQNYTGYSVGTIVGSVIGVLVVVALGASLGYFLYLRRTRRASDPHGFQEHPPPAAIPGQGPSGTSAFPGPLPDPKTTGPVYEELLNPNTEVYCRIIPRADVAS